MKLVPERLSYTLTRFSGVARFRALWRRHVRDYEYEVCQSCGRPVGLVWWCHDDKLWELVTGRTKADPGGREPAGGVWCIHCFDAKAKEVCGWIEWAPLNLRHLWKEAS